MWSKFHIQMPDNGLVLLIDSTVCMYVYECNKERVDENGKRVYIYTYMSSNMS